jgi:hypothetical protein
MKTGDELFLRQQCISARQKTGNFLNTRIQFPKLCQKFPFYMEYVFFRKNAVILHAKIGYDWYYLQLQLLIILGNLSTLIYVYFLRLSKCFIYIGLQIIFLACLSFLFCDSSHEFKTSKLSPATCPHTQLFLHLLLYVKINPSIKHFNCRVSLNNRQKISTEFLKSSFSQFYVRMRAKVPMGFKWVSYCKGLMAV